ncbi:MAG: penicillin acylase family protein [Candidatus Bipolaricaulota bacterium]
MRDASGAGWKATQAGILGVVAALLSIGVLCLQGSSPSAQPVDIVRDTWGVPHVFAATDEAAMFGLGYASAGDRMLQMEYSRRIVQGRIAEMIGSSGTDGKTPVDSDVKYRHMGTYAFLEQVAEHLDAQTRDLLQAYCDGVNAYLRSTDSLRPLFAELALRPEPWRPVDCLAVWNRVAAYFSPAWTGEAGLLHDYEELMQDGLSATAAAAQLSARTIDESAAVVQRADVDPTFLDALDVYVESLGLSGRSVPWAGVDVVPSFSHAWVVGGMRTTTGAAVLHSDPQTTVRNPSVWYEAHVVGETFDARGIGVAGCPGFLIGWNRSVAWGATALGADLADLFRLEVSTEERDSYVFDGVVYPMASRQEVVAVRGSRGVPLTTQRTHMGPVVTPLVADARPREVYVLRTIDQYYEGRHTVQTLFQMMRATGAEEFAVSLRDWLSPGVHMLFGDAEGAIGYWTTAAIPVRSALSPLGGAAAQDGSTLAADWVDIIPHELLPHVINPSSGVLFSANHLPVGTWYPLSLGIGQGGTGDSQRSWRLRELLSGTDKFAPEDVLALHFDDVSAAIRSILRAGYHATGLGQSLSREAMQCLGSLSDWYEDGAHCDSSEPHFAAAYHIARGFRQPQAGQLHDRYGGGEGGLCAFLKDLDAAMDADKDRPLDEAELAYIDASLAAGWTTAVQKYGRDPAGWREAFRSSTATLAIPYGVTLEGFPPLDRSLGIASAPLIDPEGSTLWAQGGNSYSQWVNLADVDASLALLPPGIPEHPGSVYYLAEKAEWESGTLRAAPLDRAAVEAISTSVVTLEYRP